MTALRWLKELEQLGLADADLDRAVRAADLAAVAILDLSVVGDGRGLVDLLDLRVAKVERSVSAEHGAVAELDLGVTGFGLR